MGSQDEQAEGSAAAQASALSIELEADATVGCASIQNAVPVVRSVRLTNHGDQPLVDLQVLVSCNPHFAQGARLRFARLGPGESRRIAPVDLAPDHTYLAELQESTRASIRISAQLGSEELACLTQPVEVLAYDQWAGTRALPELLAAFCMPNNPAVDGLIAEASRLLRAEHPEMSMDGYQTKRRDAVWMQTSAVYSAIAAHALQYAEPPASFGQDGQKIRTPDRVLETRVATCLDLAMLFASCLEQAGLRAAIFIKEGHAWVGVWLHPASFADPLTDDVQAVRKRVDSGELLAFETTGVAQHHSRRPSLRLAVEQGHAHLLEDDSFRYAVDIHRARELQIKPLPSRAVPLRQGQPVATEVPAAIEAAPTLPPLDPAALDALDLPADDTPQGRLSKWKARLLDLSLRNRLLNFKPNKSTLHLVAPDLAGLEDALADGTEFRIRPMPALMDGSDPRDADVHAHRGGRSPMDDMALAALANKELLARLAPEVLDGQLLTIFSAARTGLEEGGANTLYLAIGLLRWTELATAESFHLAPILLVPVTLQRQSVRSGFRLQRHDDEAIVNPTLLQMLKTSFDMRVAGLDVLPTDEKGIDVANVLQRFRLAVREIPKWEVLEQAHLGIFSFTKYLMWKDLQDRTDQLRANRVVRHLMDHPGQAFAREELSHTTERLDDTHRPQDILAPLLSDSSQLKAICAVDAGRDLVLEGPPGTGKSQTITNLIAHTLAQGKTVLFVSEKLAALEVVHRRLVAIGLGPFCLELHSSKARKSEVLQQLGKALDMPGQRTADEWLREAERLAQQRQALNGLVDALHRRHPCGLSAFEAIGTCIAHAGEVASPMPWTDPLTHSREQVDQLRDAVRRMAALAGAVGPLHGHALALIGHSEWSPSWHDNLLTNAHALDQALQALQHKAALLGQHLGTSTDGLPLHAYAALDDLADALLAAPQVPAPLARQAHDAQVRGVLQTLARHGLARNGHWARVGAGWALPLAKLNATQLQAEWSQASATWWPKRHFAMRAIKARLSAFRSDGQPPSDAMVLAMLAPLADVNEEDLVLRSMHANAEALLQHRYAGVQTDWGQLAQLDDWAQRFANAADKVAGADPAQANLQRQSLQALASEGRAALAPDANVGRALLEYRDAWRQACQAMDALNATAKPTQALAGPPGANGALARMRSVLAGWQSSRRLVQAWCHWRNVRDEAIALGLQNLVHTVERGELALADLPSHFEFSYQEWWVKKTIDQDATLRGFSSADHERKIQEFRQADARFQVLTERCITARLSGRIPAAQGVVIGPDTELGMLRRELQRQRGHLPVRRLVQGLPTLLPRLKPCLLMSPLSVAQYLDAGHAPFNLVVFDEASQIPVWDAVGAMARGEQVVVVGDPKQLPPTNFFNKSTESDNGGAGDEPLQDLESILDECLGAGMNRLSLQWHYRSRHESLITFSNVNYYDAGLITFPSPVTDDVAVKFERVQGVYDRGATRTNRIEAEAVVQGIEAHYLGASKAGLTLGVVTFNQPQQALIETLLDARRRENPNLDRAIAARSNEALFIKNLENVQGDERDVIFFSITFGADAAGKTTMNFGPLNGEGGHRRLNVAISRAREAVVIYSSLLPEQIDLAKVRAAGVRDLKHYLEFALKGPRALVEQSLPTGLEPDSPFEAAVIKQLRDRHWAVHPQVGCSGYRIDIGVVDGRAPGRYLAGIECDGRSYHSGATARDRDRLRQHVLEGLGWRILRVWSTNWWLNPEGEIDALCRQLEALQAKGEDAATEPTVGANDPVDPQVPAPPAASETTFETTAALAVEAAVPPAPLGEPALRVFEPATLPPGDPVAFYEASATAQLAAQLHNVIDNEGPLLEAVLFRRVARAWGLERTGSRIVDRLRQLLAPDQRRTQDADHVFYWPMAMDPATWRDGRVAGPQDNSRRHVDEVCPEEIAALLQHVLRLSGASPRPDAARAVCRLLGMARMTADAEARVGHVIDRMLASKDLAEGDGRVRTAA